MYLEAYQQKHIPEIEQSLKDFLNTFRFGRSQPLKEMLIYHMGWHAIGSHGKRLRPLITLLCAEALGGKAQTAMPAALAVEFLHNFTLIHDDIEDRSSIRHGRETLWMRWDEAQAINAGDALFSIAQMAMFDLKKTANPLVTLQAARSFNQTCLRLTRGQYLDIAFEKEQKISLDTYLEMAQGKTAALIGFSASVSGIIAEIDHERTELLTNFGESLGLAFQIQDDILGIWGDPEITGKSAASDLLAKKKTLPVLFGLQNCEEFQKLWSQVEITPAQVEVMASLLKSCGAQDYARDEAEKYTRGAFSALEQLFPTEASSNDAVNALKELSGNLLSRKL